MIAAPAGSGFDIGDRLVGFVRRPDPVPCPACAAGEWDMCRNGRYTECGIKGRHGYGAERFRVAPAFAIKVDRSLGILGVLVEPASIVAKAWDQIERIGRRFGSWQPRRLLVTGAGAIGLLAALMGAQRGFDVHVLDRNVDGVKPRLVGDLGARYHACPPPVVGELEADVILECTGAPSVIAAVLAAQVPSGIVCLLGLGPDHDVAFDIGRFNRTLVLAQPRGLRIGQRQSAALRDGGRLADALGQALARTAHYAARAARAMAGGARPARRRHQGRDRFHAVSEFPFTRAHPQITRTAAAPNSRPRPVASTQQ